MLRKKYIVRYTYTLTDGFADIFDLGSDRTPKCYYRVAQSDLEALQRDWSNVGNDLRCAIRKTNKEINGQEPAGVR